VGRMLSVTCTNRRLALCSMLGRTWRVVPFSDIRAVKPVHGPWPYRDVVVIEYQFNGRREVFLIWNKAAKGKDLASALTASGADIGL